MDKTCKYYKYQKYVSYDNGVTWQPLNQFQRGELMEFNSPDCGAGIEALYKWVVLDINTDYYCDDCGYVPSEIYRWRALPPEEYICSGTTKYYKEYKEVSTDGGGTWNTFYPIEYRMSSEVIEQQSDDCGYTVYRWVDSGFTCDNGNKYNQVIRQMSRDSGTTWQNITPNVFSATTLIEENSDICQEERLHVWIAGRGVNVPSLTGPNVVRLDNDGNAKHYVLYRYVSTPSYVDYGKGVGNWSTGSATASVYLHTASGIERSGRGMGCWISDASNTPSTLYLETLDGYATITAYVDDIYLQWAAVWFCTEDNLPK